MPLDPEPLPSTNHENAARPPADSGGYGFTMTRAFALSLGEGDVVVLCSASDGRPLMVRAFAHQGGCFVAATTDARVHAVEAGEWRGRRWRASWSVCFHAVVFNAHACTQVEGTEGEEIFALVPSPHVLLSDVAEHPAACLQVCQAQVSPGSLASRQR